MALACRLRYLSLVFCIVTMIGKNVASALSNPAHKGALIFMHGLGDSPAGWSQLQMMLPSMRQRLKEIKYVFPAAPTVSITINGGMTMPGWFDLFDWPIGVGSKDDKEGLLQAVEQIETEVARLGEAGIPPSKIVIGGFSQGGAIAILTAYRAKQAYAGCAGLSAWLTLPEELDVKDCKGTPMFWGHGRFDDKVLFEQQAFGVEKLREQGVAVSDEQYNMGHESHPDELAKLAEFVENCIFSDEAKSEL